MSDAQAAVRLRGEVTVLLTSDTAIRRLNRQFRGKNKATDVLSFPTEQPQNARPGEWVAGDLAVSVPTARRQAAACGHSLAIELKVLMLHGLLHLAGYDHESDSGQMARRERLLRGRLGLPQGLIERVEASEGNGLQPVRKSTRKGAALAAEGKTGHIKTASAGAKARTVARDRMYGLKPVPFKLKSVPLKPKPVPFKLKPVPFKLKPVPFTPKPVPFTPELAFSNEAIVQKSSRRGRGRASGSSKR